jgi:Tfp pilus assembly protein PilO
MSKNKSPQLFFILAALTLAAGTGATIFQYSGINEKWDDLAELKKDTRDPKDIKDELDDTSAKVAAAQTEIEHLERGVPAFAYVPTMLKELEICGKENGIEVLGVRPIPKAAPGPNDKNASGTGKKKDPYQELAIEVKGRGVFKSVQAFVVALERFPKIVGARSISIQPRNEADNPSVRKLDATIELRAFLFPPEPGAGPYRPKTGTPPAKGAGSEAGNATEAGNAPSQGTGVQTPGSAGEKNPAVAAGQGAAPAVQTNSAAVKAPAMAPVKVSSKAAPRIATKKTYKKSKRHWKRRPRR